MVRNKELSSGLLIVMAVATGSIVANLYYLQPLLHEVALSFHVGTSAATSLITLTQVGYAAGLALVVPLGDLIPRRRLITLIFFAAAVLMILGATIPSFIGFAVITAFVGLASVGGQIMIPLAADLADPDQRGRVVARLMSGLLMGILLSRTVSGFVAQVAGWRAVYWLAAGLMALFGVVLSLVLPDEPVRPHVPYGRLVTDSIRFLSVFPELRKRAWLGATSFAGFSLLWSTLAFELSSPPYHFSNGAIGAFGLLGVAGVLAANAAGSLADARRTREMTVVASGLLVISFGVLALGSHTIVAIVVGIVVLDVACQATQITNQSIIYKLAPDARSRINSAYMVCYFVGGALGSIGGGLAYEAGGWATTCALGAAIGVAGLVPALWWSLRTERPQVVESPSETT